MPEPGTILVLGSGAGALYLRFFRSRYAEFKRAIDILFAFPGLVIASPIILILAIVVKLTSRGSAFYRQERVGMDGRVFRIVKLRTMVQNAEAKTGPVWASVNDPRETPVGRFLRRTHLDELPQLWNIALGQMRFVGPRPEDPHFVDLEQPMHRLVFNARPGITGLAQLLNADEETRLVDADPERAYREVILPRKLELDAAYLRHRSTRLDLWILAQTPRAVLGHRVTLPASVRSEVGRIAGADV